MSADPTLERHARLLAEMTVTLGSVHEVGASIAEALSIAVPELADLLIVDLFAASELERVAFKLDERTGSDLSAGDEPEIAGARVSVLESGESCFSSFFVVAPVFTRGQVLGAITAVIAGERRRFSTADLALLQELGRRIARVVDHEQLCLRAEAVTRTKEEFIATLSHELRTPLTSILGWAQMLRSGQLDANTKMQAVDAIERNARAQARLVEEMIDLSRTLTGSLKLQMHGVNLSAIASSVAGGLRSTAKSKNIELTINLREPIQPIMGDTLRLRQIVWHLLTNAIKFTPAGGNIALVVEQQDQEIVLAVTDSGEGIPRAFLPHVFEHFSQVDCSSTRRHGGMGLGLAIVRHLTEIHGGTVTAESAGPHCGAKFSVRFPIAAEMRRLRTATDLQPRALRRVRVPRRRSTSSAK